MTRSGLSAVFFGTTTILFDDGQDQVLIDGFFTRPSLMSCLFWPIAPDRVKVGKVLEENGIDQRLRAVLVAHSHYDHALDAPEICKQTGAALVGSTSTYMIGIGDGLAKDQIQVVADGEVLQLGAFRITIFEGIHSPNDRMPGDITAPLSFPCAVKDMKTGKCYSYLIEHGASKSFVHPSANYVPGKLDGLQVSTLFLGVGVLGKQPPTFQEEYWQHVVRAVHAERIIPIHWDNFWKSLDGGLVPLPWFADSWSTTVKLLESRCKAEQRELCIPGARTRVEL